MKAVSTPLIQRMSVGLSTSPAIVGHKTRALIEVDRFVNRKRKRTRADDLVSVSHAVFGSDVLGAVEADDVLRSLDYVETSPKNLPQEPYFGTHGLSWGTLFGHLIRHAPTHDDPAPAPETAPRLPDMIEICFNPLYVDVVWWERDPEGGLKRIERVDRYRPTSLEAVRKSRPYGPAVGVIRKIVLTPQFIMHTAEVLRDLAPLPRDELAESFTDSAVATADAGADASAPKDLPPRGGDREAEGNYGTLAREPV